MIFLVERARQKVPTKYLVRDFHCLGCKCFKPGQRVPEQKNAFYGRWISRYEGAINVCTEWFDTGCPVDTGYSQELRRERIDAEWSTAKI